MTVALSPSQQDFVAGHPAAAMITVAADGSPRAVRVAVGIVDGKLWSSGTQTRLRTARLRRDPRCTLYVPDPGWSWLTLDTTVEIDDGEDAAEKNLRFFRMLQRRRSGPLSWFGRDLDEAEFLAAMREEQRLIYEFTVVRAYGLA